MGLIGLAALAALAMPPRILAASDADICEKQSGDVAIAACSRAIATGRYHGRDLAILYDNRGVEYVKKRDLDRAFADYNEALRIDSKFPSAYNNRGDAWRTRGDLEKALTDLNRAIELDPRHANAYYNRGLVWEARHELQRALADFKRFTELAPSDPDGPQAVARVTGELSRK